MSSSAAKEKVYDASSLTVLDGISHVRARPAMYLGSTGPAAVFHCLVEIVGNSVDEAVAGYGKHILIMLHPDGSVEVTDDGRGIPVDKEPISGKPGVVTIFTTLFSGGKFDSNSYKTSGGLHGVGASVVNALSTRLEARIKRDGYLWGVDFQFGVPGTLYKLNKVPKNETGSSIRYWLDADMFDGKNTEINTASLIEHCQARAYLIPGLTIELQDLRNDPPQTKTWHSEKGIVDYLQVLSTHAAINDPIVVEATDSYVIDKRVVEGSTGHIESISRTCEVRVALRWCTNWDLTLSSWANLIVTPQGGSHVNGFWQAMTRVINEYARNNKYLRAKEPGLTKDDLSEGLVAIIEVRLPEPQFEGQTKSALATPQIHSIVYKAMTDTLTEWLNRSGSRAQVKAVLTKLVAAARTRAAARAQRDTARKANALSSATLPAKLADCRSHAPHDSELLIVEGNSAAGPAKAGRNSQFQAVLPLRGKIINADKGSLKDVLANAEVVSIFASLGVTPGRLFNLQDLRMERVILLSDADTDGLHIRCLLLTLFYHFATPMLEDKRVYCARPPLFTIRQNSKADRYAYSDAERDRVVANLKGAYQISRFKGLGEMDVSELAVTCLNPATRILQRVTMDDAAAAADMFDLLMGKKVEPRKMWLMKNAIQVDLAELDLT